MKDKTPPKTVTPPVDVVSKDRQSSGEDQGSWFDNFFLWASPSSKGSPSHTSILSSSVDDVSRGPSAQTRRQFGPSASSPNLFPASSSTISPAVIPSSVSSARCTDDEPAWFQECTMPAFTVRKICQKIVELTLQVATTPNVSEIMRLSAQIDALARDVPGDLSSDELVVKRCIKRQERLTAYLSTLSQELQNNFLNAIQFLSEEIQPLLKAAQLSDLKLPLISELRAIAEQSLTPQTPSSSRGPSSSR